MIVQYHYLFIYLNGKRVKQPKKQYKLNTTLSTNKHNNV